MALRLALPKHFECVIAETHKEGYWLLGNLTTGWLGELRTDLENKTYKITIICDSDTVSLGYFREFLKEDGWEEE